jgi:adenylate kinase family enzyme
LLGDRLKNTDRWILSGSLCGWGDEFIPLFDLAIYLWIPQDIRLDRIIKREKQRYGKEIEAGGSMYESHLEFVDWASQYDKGDLNIRSKALHEKWISELNCQLLRLEGDFKLEEKVQKVLEILRAAGEIK